MAKVLIRVAPATPDDAGAEFFFEGNRRSAYGVFTKNQSDDFSTPNFEFFSVDEVDIDNTLSELTKTFPAREVSVYKTEKSAIRPAGDMVVKNVTTNGVLP